MEKQKSLEHFLNRFCRILVPAEFDALKILYSELIIPKIKFFEETIKQNEI